MPAALADYGPQRATWAEGEVGLGRRGAAAPEPGPSGRGEPPFPPPFSMHRDAGFVVAADARLDERDALCDALGAPPPERTGLADAELILRAFLRWGRDCPHHLHGGYAFAVWDPRKRVLFCARDHAGARPFYYAPSPRRFVFASAVEAILAAPGVSDALDEVAVATHLAGSPYLGARTFCGARAARRRRPSLGCRRPATRRRSRNTRGSTLWSMRSVRRKVCRHSTACRPPRCFSTCCGATGPCPACRST